MHHISPLNYLLEGFYLYVPKLNLWSKTLPTLHHSTFALASWWPRLTAICDTKATNTHAQSHAGDKRSTGWKRTARRAKWIYKSLLGLINMSSRSTLKTDQLTMIRRLSQPIKVLLMTRASLHTFSTQSRLWGSRSNRQMRHHRNQRRLNWSIQLRQQTDVRSKRKLNKSHSK